MQCILYGILNDEKYQKMHDISRRVYDPNGIAPTIHCVGGGNLEPKIVENNSIRNTDNRAVEKAT